MTENPNDILTHSISTTELKRRWQAVREKMKERGLDFLVMQNDNEWLGGYVKWFTDIPARNAQAHTVIFPLDDEMTTITHGGQPPGDLGPPAWTLRGVKTRLTAPYFQSVSYTNTYDAELAVNVFKGHKRGRIGIVGKGGMSAAFYDHLRNSLPEAVFSDASCLVDPIKAVKSDEEIDLIKKAAGLQDEVMTFAKGAIRPGRRDFEIIADIIHKATELGSEEQLVLGSSGSLGKPVPMQKRHFQNRIVREGDQFTLMIEANGPGGMYSEIGRIFFLGRVPSNLQDAFETAKEIQQTTLRRIKPGADPVEIWEANNTLLQRRGFLPETRAYAHGQGYDLVERPLIRNDETMPLEANMNITVHPTIGSDKLWVWVCDNYLITESGVSGCLHRSPQEIYSIC
ncbi:MAG: family metallopeptidase [Deltaproteobacteria bacterium]|jgi:Xaa-Pro aminopeptidase|nr:family metallopeptidase [Deltaproteobacteria bacterium]